MCGAFGDWRRRRASAHERDKAHRRAVDDAITAVQAWEGAIQKSTAVEAAWAKCVDLAANDGVRRGAAERLQNVRVRVAAARDIPGPDAMVLSGWAMPFAAAARMAGSSHELAAAVWSSAGALSAAPSAAAVDAELKAAAAWEMASLRVAEAVRSAERTALAAATPNGDQEAKLAASDQRVNDDLAEAQTAWVKAAERAESDGDQAGAAMAAGRAESLAELLAMFAAAKRAGD